MLETVARFNSLCACFFTFFVRLLPESSRESLSWRTVCCLLRQPDIKSWRLVITET